MEKRYFTILFLMVVLISCRNKQIDEHSSLDRFNEINTKYKKDIIRWDSLTKSVLMSKSSNDTIILSFVAGINELSYNKVVNQLLIEKKLFLGNKKIPYLEFSLVNPDNSLASLGTEHREIKIHGYFNPLFINDCLYGIRILFQSQDYAIHPRDGMSMSKFLEQDELYNHIHSILTKKYGTDLQLTNWFSLRDSLYYKEESNWVQDNIIISQQEHYDTRYSDPEYFVFYMHQKILAREQKVDEIRLRDNERLEMREMKKKISEQDGML